MPAPNPALGQTEDRCPSPLALSPAEEEIVLAKHFIEETCISQGIQAGQLSIHADRGASMRSKPVASLLSDLGVAKSHSRPQVSNDNPYSESQFKTL
jgi:putative transposase